MPRGVLKPGDRFRVSGGPVYVTDDGRKLSMFERGVFVFERYCVQGAAQWLEAQRAGGGDTVVLWVGRPSAAPPCPTCAADLTRSPASSAKRRPIRDPGTIPERSIV